MGIASHSVVALAGGIAGAVGTYHTQVKNKNIELKRIQNDAEKMHEFYTLLLRWIRIHQEGKNAVSYFEKHSYKSVAIYGMKELGESLLYELENTSINVEYGIDQNAESVYVPVDVYKPNDELRPVDVIVVTAVHYFDEIEEDLRKRVNCPIVSLEDVVWEA